MNIKERNQKAKNFIQDKLDLVENFSEEHFKRLPNYKELVSILEDLIPVKAKGFRGIVATAITGKFLDPLYDPLNNFYGCNPRAIFEQGIYYAFENRVPCGKSDPLNVAKNTNVLNYEWAKGKRPYKAAQATVSYLTRIEESKKEHREDVVNLFFFKLLKYSKSVKNIPIAYPKASNISHQLFSKKLLQFILQCPESGTVPQTIVTKLLEKLYVNSNINVLGGGESVFGTNTTSKKLADLWLELQHNPFNLFEITVKKIDYKRLDDCIQSLTSLNALGLPIHFICRLPQDISELSKVEDNTLEYKGITFNFLDISEFVKSISSLLSNIQIEELIKEIYVFVNDINRPVNTKTHWNELFK